MNFNIQFIYLFISLNFISIVHAQVYWNLDANATLYYPGGNLNYHYQGTTPCTKNNQSFCQFNMTSLSEKDQDFGITKPTGYLQTPWFHCNLDGYEQSIMDKMHNIQGFDIQRQHIVIKTWKSLWMKSLNFSIIPSINDESYIVFDHSFDSISFKVKTGVTYQTVNQYSITLYKNQCYHVDQIRIHVWKNLSNTDQFDVSMCTTRASAHPKKMVYVWFEPNPQIQSLEFYVQLQPDCESYANFSAIDKCQLHPACPYRFPCGLEENCVNNQCICTVENFSCSQTNRCGQNICGGIACGCLSGQSCINHQCVHNDSNDNSNMTLVITLVIIVTFIILLTGWFFIMRKRQARQRQIEERQSFLSI